jgi:hypothetical protein
VRRARQGSCRARRLFGVPRTLYEVNRRAQLDEWISVVGRLVGLVFLIVFGVVWVLTQHVEPLLVASFGALYGIAKGGEALALLRRAPPEPPSVPDTTTRRRQTASQEGDT